MKHEVIVVGGGIGGLTTAALLAARGANVCLFERNQRVGGCASTFEKFSYTFELGAGVYAGWNAGEIHEKVFEELNIGPPETRLLSPAYSVRLPDGLEIPITTNDEEFELNLRAAFPECADAAVEFYREIEPISEALQRLIKRAPDLRTLSGWRKIKAVFSEAGIAPKIFSLVQRTAAQHLTKTSSRFRRFVDAQLQIFGLCPSEECAYLYAAVALTLPRRGMHGIRGGAQGLADILVQSIKQNGGTVRLNSPVLRLANDSSGRAIGVDLLSGERVEAKTIVSNLTVWDTYGKLFGPDKTPSDVRQKLKLLHGWGAYLIFLALNEERAQNLSAERILVLSDWRENQPFDAEDSLFMFSAAPAWDAGSAPQDHRAVTFSTFTETEKWFAYHEDDSAHEELDRVMLESCWRRLHAMMPELGDDIEIIETMTPFVFYENTRRRLGIVGGAGQSLDVFGLNSFSHQTHLQNVFMVGDSVFPGNGVAAVTQSALITANKIAPPRKR
jgi:C-3',4' desaturase CrtD